MVASVNADDEESAFVARRERHADAKVDVMFCAFIHFALIVEALGRSDHPEKLLSEATSQR
jgi:hypothetical protein